MENVLIRVEEASSKKLPVTSATPRTALIAPLMGMVIEPPTVRANASVAEVNGTSAEEGIANGIIQLLPNITPNTNPKQTPRVGGGRGSQLREGRGGGGRGGQAEAAGNSFHGGRYHQQEVRQPIRCPTEVTPNVYCSFANHTYAR